MRFDISLGRILASTTVLCLPTFEDLLCKARHTSLVMIEGFDCRLYWFQNCSELNPESWELLDEKLETEVERILKEKFDSFLLPRSFSCASPGLVCENEQLLCLGPPDLLSRVFWSRLELSCTFILEDGSRRCLEEGSRRLLEEGSRTTFLEATADSRMVRDDGDTDTLVDPGGVGEGVDSEELDPGVLRGVADLEV